MNIRNLFSKTRQGSKLPKSKRVVHYKGLIIKLYEVDWQSTDPSRNIEAFSADGSLKWILERPTHSFHYWDMQIDEEKGELDADSGDGQHYTISLVDGHIIDSRLIK